MAIYFECNFSFLFNVPLTLPYRQLSIHFYVNHFTGFMLIYRYYKQIKSKLNKKKLSFFFYRIESNLSLLSFSCFKNLKLDLLFLNDECHFTISLTYYAVIAPVKCKANKQINETAIQTSSFSLVDVYHDAVPI